MTALRSVRARDIVGAGDLERLLTVERQTVDYYRAGRNAGEPFPKPIATPSCGPVWDRREVLAWKERERARRAP